MMTMFTNRNANQVANPTRFHAFKRVCLAGLLATAAASCATAGPSKELVDARTAYARLEAGSANATIPAEVHDAKLVLDRAEQTQTIDDAYLAQRKAQLVESHASTLKAQAQRDQATKDLQAARLARGDRAEKELGVVRKDLVSAENKTAMTQQQLDAERIARLDAEQKSKEAMDNLAKMAALKQESRGLVITLSGAVMFVTNQSALLPAALASLNNVAAALKTTPDRSIMVEGHSDSTGAHAYNVDLSQRRADAVRLYLISQAVPQEMIRAQGIGPDRPVADNSTAEGRANNRRVEIVVSPSENK
jgi:outer membrane protein OmpA-like peptidoglycan-associated protein